MRKLIKYFFLFMVGGLIYYTIECIYVGHSHPSMYILGGICFICIGLLNEYFNDKMSLVSQMVVSALIITVLEFFGGIIINRYLKYNVWDYSDMPYNLMGQINLLTSAGWFLLSLPAILLSAYLRHRFFYDEKYHYKIF